MTLTYTNVTLKQKPSRNDHISYVDYYPAISNFLTMKMSRQEILSIQMNHSESSIFTQLYYLSRTSLPMSSMIGKSQLQNAKISHTESKCRIKVYKINIDLYSKPLQSVVHQTLQLALHHFLLQQLQYMRPYVS